MAGYMAEYAQTNHYSIGTKEEIKRHIRPILTTAINVASANTPNNSAINCKYFNYPYPQKDTHQKHPRHKKHNNPALSLKQVLTSQILFYNLLI